MISSRLAQVSFGDKPKWYHSLIKNDTILAYIKSNLYLTDLSLLDYHNTIPIVLP